MSEIDVKTPPTRPAAPTGRARTGRADRDRGGLDDRQRHLRAALPDGGQRRPAPLLIGWIITGVGMLMLAFVFQTLAQRKPEVDGGVYGYAKAGFGNYIGFTSAFGYWVSAWMGNVAYLVLLFATLGNFIPALEGGTTKLAILCASVLLWVLHALTLRGTQTAAFVNTIVTIAKVVPILTFIAIAAVGFKAGLFSADIWGKAVSIDGVSLGDTLHQVKAMMLITVWVFIGIEGAAVYSKRAASRTRRRTGHRSRVPRGARPVAAGELPVLRADGPGRHRRAVRPSMARAPQAAGRKLGRDIHLGRSGRLTAGGADRVDHAVRRNHAGSGTGSCDARLPGEGEQPSRTGRGVVAD